MLRLGEPICEDLLSVCVPCMSARRVSSRQRNHVIDIEFAGVGEHCARIGAGPLASEHLALFLVFARLER